MREVLGYLAVLFILFIILAFISAASCESAWSKSGFETSWGPVQGCLIKMPDGRWIPDESYREIP
jgi:hypothetical protein